MKALILNSGIGSRMGAYTQTHPKCMTEITSTDTILSRQLKLLYEAGIEDIVITTGLFDEVLVDYCESLNLPIKFTFVKNELFRETNYIYSIYCAREYLNDDIIMMHGDLVFDARVLNMMLNLEHSSMVTSSAVALPEKDFKAVIASGENGECISKVGIDCFDNAVAAQPLYFLKKADWTIWLDEIVSFCESKIPEKVKCYAENAFNEVSDKCIIRPMDVKNMLCAEIDNPDDLKIVSDKVKALDKKLVYMCFSTDVLHSGHLDLIKKARSYGRLVIGVMSDEAVAMYKRLPLLPFEERVSMFRNINGVYKVVKQDGLSYKNVLKEIKPDYVVHGDDWVEGFQKPIREEVIAILQEFGGQLIEFPYSKDNRFTEIEKRTKMESSLPDMRRAKLRKAINLKKTVTAIEAHSGLTGLIAETTMVYENGQARQFDAMWVSSLCDSTAKGKPDIELVDMTSRFRTIDDICEVTTKPIIFDGDTGGLTEHFVYTVRSLERMGVSMVIIEDKTGLKKNSLFGTEVAQTQDSIENFCAKISAGKKAQKTADFMICARIESLILEQGMEDALERAFAYVKAGADAIMIHSRKKNPDEIFEFVECFREKDAVTPIVVVPTSFNTVSEEEFKKRGVNIIIYANQLTRTAFPAMKNAAELILKNHRAKECDDVCMSIKEIISLIPEE